MTTTTEGPFGPFLDDDEHDEFNRWCQERLDEAREYQMQTDGDWSGDETIDPFA